MAQTKNEIRAILAAAETEPRHRFGQNFMIDGNLVRLVADAGEIAVGDLVVEVGPGTGTLTEELLERGAEVLAVEIDRNLAGALRARFASEPRFRLIEGDALAGKHAINGELAAALRSASGRPRKLVANLPYNIASPLVIELLIEGLDLLAFTVQKEVADRMRAAAGSDAYGPLSVIGQMLGSVEVLRTLPPGAFWPPPSIDSALVRVKRHDRIGMQAGAFGRFVHQLFSARRKTLRKALSQADYPADKLIAALSLDPQARPETLSPRVLYDLFTATGSADAIGRVIGVEFIP